MLRLADSLNRIVCSQELIMERKGASVRPSSTRPVSHPHDSFNPNYRRTDPVSLGGGGKGCAMNSVTAVNPAP